ncbi:unnamed protein product, partial [Ectocarpus sp. 12 AP-2014]
GLYRSPGRTKTRLRGLVAASRPRTLLYWSKAACSTRVMPPRKGVAFYTSRGSCRWWAPCSTTTPPGATIKIP